MKANTSQDVPQCKMDYSEVWPCVVSAMRNGGQGALGRLQGHFALVFKHREVRRIPGKSKRVVPTTAQSLWDSKVRQGVPRWWGILKNPIRLNKQNKKKQRTNEKKGGWAFNANLLFNDQCNIFDHVGASGVTYTQQIKKSFLFYLDNHLGWEKLPNALCE